MVVAVMMVATVAADVMEEDETEEIAMTLRSPVWKTFVRLMDRKPRGMPFRLYCVWQLLVICLAPTVI